MQFTYEKTPPDQLKEIDRQLLEQRLTSLEIERRQIEFALNHIDDSIVDARKELQELLAS